jgi:hypothetical protein
LVGNFLNDVDEVMGLPVDRNTPIAELFRQAVRARTISKMPVGL